MNAAPIRKIVLTLGIALGVLAGCDVFSSDKKDPPKVDNDIAVDETVKGAIPSSLVKRYTFTADSGYTYTFLVNSTDDDVYEKIQRADTAALPKTNELSYRTYSASSANWDDSLIVACGKTGTYVFLIEGKQGVDFQVVMTRKSGFPDWFTIADGYESDNTLKTAKAITTDSTVQKRSLVAPSNTPYGDDYDWISIKCDSGYTYTVHETGVSSSYFAIYTADSTILSTTYTSTYDNATSKTTYRREFGVVKSGTYYVRIYGSGYNYSIAVTAEKGISSALLPDQYEADNTMGAAKTIPSDSTVQRRSLHYGSGYDIDWIAIKCDSGKRYTVSANGIASSQFGINTSDSNYLSTTSTSSYNSASGTYTYSRTFAVTKSATYYVRVVGDDVDGATYRIAVSSEAGLYGDSYEDDDKLSTAKTIPTDSTVQKRSMYYDTEYDVDWVAMKCDSGKTYTVYLSGLGSSYFSIYKPDSTFVSTSYDYNSSSSPTVYYRSFGVTKSGTYYVRVYYNSSSSEMKYTLAVTAKQGISPSLVGDKYEYDNNASSAKTIPTDSTIQTRSHHYDGSYDIDWIAIKCDSGKTYTVHQNGLSSYFEIFKPDSTTLISTTSTSKINPNTGTYVYSRSFGAAKSGTFYVVFTSSTSTVTNYTVAVTARNGISASLVGDQYEDDNTLKTAKTITTDSTVQTRTFHYDGSYDVDWIALKCDSGYTYAVDQTVIGSSFAIYSNDSTTVSTSYNTFNSGSQYIYRREFSVVKTGTYYIRNYSNTSVTTNYTTAVKARKGLDIALVGDSYESDNTLRTAKSIKTDSTVQLRSFHTSASVYTDNDWISFKADSGHTYKFYSSRSGTSYYFDADSVGLPSASVSFYDSKIDSEYYRTVMPISKSGTYYIRMYGSSPIKYWVAMVDSAGLPMWAKPDAGEPDHDLASASTIKADSSYIYRSLKGNDTDWVKVPVVQNRAYNFRIVNGASSGSYTDMTIDILDSTNKSLFYNTLSYGSTLTTGQVAMKDGALWVRVRPYSYSTTTTIPYSILVSSAPLPQDAREPDRSLSTAVAIPSDSLAITRWVGFNDSDWMSIAVDSGRKFTVFVGIPSSSTTSTTVYYRLFSRDSIVAAYSSLYSIGYTTQTSFTPRYTGKMYLQVYNGSKGVVTPYTVRIENFPIDSTEPDDSLSQARSVPTDSSAIPRIIEGLDADWVKFPVTAGRIYRFDLTSEYSTLLALHTPEGAAATLLNGSYSSSTTPAFFEAKTSQTMYARLTNQSSLTDLNAIRLRISSFANDSTEPINSTAAGALALGTDSVPAKGLLLGSDQDFFAVMLDSGTTYKFEYATDGDVSAYMALLTSELSSSYVFSSITQVQAYTATATGKHYLRMTSNSSVVPARYSVAVSKIANDSFELDNTFPTAKPITVGTETQKRILTKGDVDWISVPVDSGAVYSMYVNATDYLYTAVYTDDELIYNSALSVSPGMERTAQTFTIKRKCKLYVKVTPYNSATISNPYTVRVVKN